MIRTDYTYAYTHKILTRLIGSERAGGTEAGDRAAVLGPCQVAHLMYYLSGTSNCFVYAICSRI